MAPTTGSKSRRNNALAVAATAKPSRIRKHGSDAAIALRKLTALEESDLLYEASIAARKEEKALLSQKDCAICCESFSPPHLNPYSCPNEKCTVRFCIRCKTEQLKKDYRCPFCRSKLDGATLSRPIWSRNMTPNEMNDATRALIGVVESTPTESELPVDEDAPAPTDDGRYLGPSPRSVRHHELTWMGHRDISTAPDDELPLGLFDPDRHSSAVVESVRRGTMTALEAWQSHFSNSGVPIDWLQDQEEELKSIAHRLESETQTRAVVDTLKAKWKFEMSTGYAP